MQTVSGQATATTSGGSSGGSSGSSSTIPLKGETVSQYITRTKQSTPEALKSIKAADNQRKAAQIAAAKKQTVAEYVAKGGSLPGTKTEKERLLQQQEARNVIAKKFGVTNTAEYLAAGGYLPGTKTQQEATEQQKQAEAYLLSKTEKSTLKTVKKEEPSLILTGTDVTLKGNYTSEPKSVTEARAKQTDTIGKTPFQTTGYEYTEYERPRFTWGEFKENPIKEIRELPTVLRDVSERARTKQLQIDPTRSSGPAFAAGIAVGVIDPVLHPVEFVKSYYSLGKGLLTDPRGTTQGIVQQIKLNPEKEAGKFIGNIALFKGLAYGIKKAPVTIETESYNFKVQGGGQVKSSTVGVKVGSKGYTVASRVKVDPSVTDVATGQPVSTKVSSGLPFVTDTYSSYSIGSPNKLSYSSRAGALNQPIPFSDLAGSQTQPLTASGGKAIRSGVLDYSPEEIARVESNVRLAYSLGTEKGLPVKEFVVNIEGVKNPATVSKMVEGFVGDQGIIYGSLTTKQLPGEISGPYSLDYLKDVRTGGTVGLQSFQNVKQGDIDVTFPGLTVAEIKPRIAEFTKQLQARGENVQVSPTGKGTVIEFKPETTGKQGEKFLEAKSGIDQEAAGLEDQAPAAYLGINFADIKAGQKPTSVPFGETRAITAGEQLQRKGAGATIMSSGLPGETPSFSEAGILGKQGNPRGLKDTAGFVQGAAGIIEIKQSSINPFNRIRGEASKKQLSKFLSSYTPEQQTDILNKLDQITGSEGIKVELGTTSSQANTGSSGLSSLIIKTIPSSSFSSTGISQSVSITPSTIYAPSLSIVSKVPTSSISTEYATSKGFSLSSSDRAKLEPYIGFRSPSKSPKEESPSPSPSLATSRSSSSGSSGGSPSPFIPSPSPIPPSPSPSPGPGSPSPGLGSPSTTFVPLPDQNKPIPKFFSMFDNKKKETKGSFEVLVRRHDMFKRIATTDTAAKAIYLGKFRVENTAAASFKVKPMGSQSTGSIRTAAKRLLPSTNFYESKKDPFTFIEKKERRIKSAGEKREITYTGIFASRSKGSKTKKRFLEIF